MSKLCNAIESKLAPESSSFGSWANCIESSKLSELFGLGVEIRLGLCIGLGFICLSFSCCCLSDFSTVWVIRDSRSLFFWDILIFCLRVWVNERGNHLMEDEPSSFSLFWQSDSH